MRPVSQVGGSFTGSGFSAWEELAGGVQGSGAELDSSSWGWVVRPQEVVTSISAAKIKAVHRFCIALSFYLGSCRPVHDHPDRASSRQEVFSYSTSSTVSMPFSR